MLQRSRKNFEDLGPRQKRARLSSKRFKLENDCYPIKLGKHNYKSSSVEKMSGERNVAFKEQSTFKGYADETDDECLTDFSVYDSESDSKDQCENDILPPENSLKLNKIEQQNFIHKIKKCFQSVGINFLQGKEILKVMRTHSCLQFLPRDCRTIMGTANFSCNVIKMGRGEYCHIGLANTLKQQLRHHSEIPTVLELDLHADGASAVKVGQMEYWPLQCRIVNTPNKRPLIVGLYRGKTKPDDSNELFKPLIEEFNNISKEGGFIYEFKRIGLKFRCFIADAPARAYVMRHRNHVSKSPCSKCKAVAIRVVEKLNGKNRRVNTIPGVEHIPRTPADYLNRTDQDHHLPGTASPLIDFNICLVFYVVFEYMHLVCIGVMKKILEGLVKGKFELCKKLASSLIEIISARLIKLDETCPTDFQRRPKAITEFKDYKATEFRHLLLYSGPIVFHGVLSEEYYQNFLLLHLAIRILCSPHHTERRLEFARNAIKLFVESAEQLYGKAFLSYNVHGLLHLVDDAKRFGPLDEVSAFPFENNIRSIPKHVRNQHRSLEQFSLRTQEHNYESPQRDIRKGIVASQKHNKGPLPESLLSQTVVQYKVIHIDETCFSLNGKDNCCKIGNEIFSDILNIIQLKNELFFVIKRYANVQEFYSCGFSSKEVGIFKCSDLSNGLELIPLFHVSSKCYKAQSWSDDKSDLLSVVADEFIIIEMLHEYSEVDENND